MFYVITPTQLSSPHIWFKSTDLQLCKDFIWGNIVDLYSEEGYISEDGIIEDYDGAEVYKKGNLFTSEFCSRELAIVSIDELKKHSYAEFITF